MTEATTLHLFKEKEIITPLTEVLQAVSPTTNSVKKQEKPSNTLTTSLDALFPEQQHDEKDIQKVKQVLGDTANTFTPEQLRDTAAEVKYLCMSWLDDFERERFNGLTLSELLHEKGKR